MPIKFIPAIRIPNYVYIVINDEGVQSVYARKADAEENMKDNCRIIKEKVR